MIATETTTRLFDGLCQHVRRTPDRKGEVWTPCPFCGKDEGKRKSTHFSFSERGFRCFVCGESGGLKRLAEQLNARPSDLPVRIHQLPTPPAPPRFWQTNPQAVLHRLLESPTRLQDWQAYKPLTVETIARWRLGAGVLPSSACRHKRLIYPLVEDGRIVGFRGRSTGCDCPKWLTAGGSTTVLFGLDQVIHNAEVILVENPVDALLAMQETPGVVAVASTAGAGTWREAWTEELRRRRPAHVTVWLDNDLAGCPNPQTYVRLRQAWMQLHPGKHPPEPNGPRIATALQAAGVRCSLYRWPSGTPAKYDIGAALMDGRRLAA
jgi:hypothetical protein